MGSKVASRVRGLSDEAFDTEDQGRSALVRLRWPDGFVRPSCDHRGHQVLAGRGKLPPVRGFRKHEITRGAKRWLTSGAEVVTEGLGCWSMLAEAEYGHHEIRTGSGRQAARMAPFKWVNTTLGRIKIAITGTYRKLSPDLAERCLASFVWCYNRRYKLETMIPRFDQSAARINPTPYRLVFSG